ncbi:MAG: ThiF family adenylyltransferase [Deltaproteobacteria bacterium]|nr:ThiF family adenylyltransferase [Deltaproteobacteria bacterium]
MSLNFHRQLDVLDVPRLAQLPITVIGAGAVGSCTVLALAKSGAERITVYDDDRIEAHNLPNQWYRLADLGRPKVEALRDLVRDMAGVELDIRPHRFDGKGASEVTICAVDSMDVRIALWRQLHPRPRLYIDARMGAEVGKVLCVGPFASWYDETLYPSSEALQAPCTARATMYCASGLGAFIASQVANYASDRPTRQEMTVDFRNGIML